MAQSIEQDAGAKSMEPSATAHAEKVRELFDGLHREVQRTIAGQHDLIDFVLLTLIAGGHALIEGVPGLGKTLLVRTLASSIRSPMSRIQFTPDLMPADITGTTVLTEREGGGHELRFQAGPLVASVILADEINRATPKTQSALLEAMQEGQITVAGRSIKLPELFMVLATQNPLEHEGTYPLPEAQLDRFLVKLLVDYPSEAEYHAIIERTTGLFVPSTEAKFTSEDVLSARAVARAVPASHQVRGYAIRITMGTQPDSPYAIDDVRRFVAVGAGPRAVQALLLLAKVKCLLQGRFTVSCEDIRSVAVPVLRHRMILNFSGLADRVKPDVIVKSILDATSELSS